MCLRGGGLFEKCKQIFENWKKPPPLKHILALPTWGQKCLVSAIEQIKKVNFDLGHPVCGKVKGRG